MQIFSRWRPTASLVFATCLACFASTALAALAADFDMSLAVKSDKQQGGAKFTEELPSAKHHPVESFTTEPNETFLISWKATNASKQNTFEDVLVHCMVISQQDLEHADGPKLNNALQESALTMDFKPGDDAKGEFSLKLVEPGTYRVRIETKNMADKYGHDYYAELNLVCQKPSGAKP